MSLTFSNHRRCWAAGFAVLVGLAGMAAATAEGLPILPGKWQTRITSRITPYLPEPRVQTRVDCISETRFDPSVMMHKYVQLDCATNRATRSGNTLTWHLACRNPALPNLTYAGTGTFTADSKTKGHGTMTINMAVPGLEPSVMRVQSVTTRLGAC